MTNEQDLQRIKKLDNWYINFRTFLEAQQAIEASLFQFKKTAVATHLLIIGESGAGKSTLCDYICSAHPKKQEPEGDRIEVLKVSIPPIPTIGSIINAFLTALGDPEVSRGTLSQRLDRAMIVSRSCRVRMIILDEAQHLYDRGNTKTHHNIGDWFKNIINDLGVPTIMVGLPRVEELFRINDQLRRRFSSRYRLDLGKPEKSNTNEYLNIFMSLAQVACININIEPYSQQEMNERLYYASDGRIAYIKKIIMAALTQVINGMKGPITISTLEFIFQKEISWDSVGPLNPFNHKFEFRRLDRKGEAFEYAAINFRK